MSTHPLHGLPRWARLSALQRQGIALAAALLVGYAVAGYAPQSSETGWLGGWVAYCAAYLATAWQLAMRLDAQATLRRAQWIDPGAKMLFVLGAAAACASVVAVALAVETARSQYGLARWSHLGLAMASLAASWLLIQTVFALHYARLYYRPPPTGGEPAAGLAFPGARDPDYLDFFYFAAVIGMTSQVSDVAVTSRRMRRLTLVHGLLSFAFNLVVLALGVNVFASSLA